MQNRVIIENVKPQVEGGRYFVKRVVGENVAVEADIFGDGHDVIRASLLVKHESDKKWAESFLILDTNDLWKGSFLLEKKGLYHYKIEAWIDHLATWHTGFLKKQADGQHLDVELQIGEKLLIQAASNYAKKSADSLKKAAKILTDTKKYKEAVAYVCSEDFANLVEEHPLKQFVTTYDKNLKVRSERKLSEFSAWYEVFPRSTSPDVSRAGTLRDVEAILPRVKEFGFDILYLPPVHPIGEINRKGKNNAVTAQAGEPGSPWAIGSQYGGHKAVEPALGTLEDYKRLVDKAHEMGIEIALDLALQCAPDHPYVKEHPEWFTWRPDGTIMYAENPPKKYQDIVPINFECADWKNLWEELKSIVIFWCDLGVTVFRVDNPHTKPIPFWEWCIAEVHKKYPDTIFLSEAFTRPKIMASLAKAGFTQSYTYYTWRTKKAEIVEYMQQLTQTESREYYRPNFWPNTPDILPYHLHGRNNNAFFLRLAMAATLTSSYGVYGPVYEFGFNESFHGKEEYFNSEKYEVQHFNWNERNRLTHLMTLLNNMRRNNTALQTTWNIQFSETNNEHLFSYYKISDDTEGGAKNIIWCVANLDTENTQNGYIEVPKTAFNIKGEVNIKVEDLLTGEIYDWTNDWNFVELNPYKSPLHIFKVHIL